MDTPDGTVARRVGVLGAAGRMGRTTCDAVAAAPDLDLVAVADPMAVGDEVASCTVLDGVEAVVAAGVDVVVDFTVADAARANLPVLAAAGVHAVVGTSGLGDDDRAALDAAFTSSACLIVPNFAIGAVLMQRFAEMAAPWFDTAEVIELHHDGKVDAPSGTALATAERMAAASPDWAEDPTEREVVPGARGGAGPAGIRLHAVRMRGMVAHQEIVLGTTGQTLTIRHDSIDRDSFMPGVVLAARGVDGTGCAVGLDALLGL
ncbi:MAG: 4-hydroxy-tetrahydrodipicolinate reductase [Acidimicrobiaceae bacterium]|nr:4-hydroxy-tetrahydrodipicolinate reductase [Acidimicrobiaceae bacterium]